MQLVPHVLTVKRKNLHCQKQPQGAIFENIVHQIQLQIYKENNQQGAFTPIRFAKQLD